MRFLHIPIYIYLSFNMFKIRKLDFWGRNFNQCYFVWKYYFLYEYRSDQGYFSKLDACFRSVLYQLVNAFQGKYLYTQPFCVCKFCVSEMASETTIRNKREGAWNVSTNVYQIDNNKDVLSYYIMAYITRYKDVIKTSKKY